MFEGFSNFNPLEEEVNPETKPETNIKGYFGMNESKVEDEEENKLNEENFDFDNLPK